MRVTQSMLSTNMLRNLSSSYSKMGVLQDQLNTGKKITRPSQDPVVAMKGIGYRTDLNRVEQYQRNLGEATNWVDTTDGTLDDVGQALHRVKDLILDAANDTKTPEDRQMIAKEIEQIRAQLQDFGNSKIGDKFIFSGTNTLQPLFDKNKVVGPAPAPAAPIPPYNANGFLEAPGVGKDVNIEINDGVELKVNTNGIGLFDKIDEMMGNLHTALKDGVVGGPRPNFDAFITEADANMDLVLKERADIGANQNRVEMMENRLANQFVTVTDHLSKNEDVDYAKAITELITQESIHRAGLSIGGRIIQPSLVDFLR